MIARLAIRCLVIASAVAIVPQAQAEQAVDCKEKCGKQWDTCRDDHSDMYCLGYYDGCMDACEFEP